MSLSCKGTESGDRCVKAERSSEAIDDKGFLRSTGHPGGLLWMAFHTLGLFSLKVVLESSYTLESPDEFLQNAVLLGWGLTFDLLGFPGDSTACPDAYALRILILSLRQLDWMSHPLVCSTTIYLASLCCRQCSRCQGYSRGQGR